LERGGKRSNTALVLLRVVAHRPKPPAVRVIR
jgi:hypothetical protein